MRFVKRLFSYVAPYKIKAILAILCTIFYTLSRASQPFLIGLAISELSKNMMAGTGINFVYIGTIGLCLLCSGIFDALGDYTSNYLLAGVIQKAMYDIRMDIKHKLDNLPVGYFDSHKQGDILGRITTDVDVVSSALQQGILKIFAAFLTLFFSIVFMFMRSWFFGFIMLIIFPISAWAFKKLFNYGHPMFVDLQNELGRLNAFTNEVYSGYEVIQLFGQEEQMIKKHGEITENIAEVGFHSNFTASVINPILNHIIHLFYIMGFTLMALTVLNKPLMLGGIVVATTIDVGQLQSFVQYIWQFGSPIRDITQLSNVLQAALASLERVCNLLDEQEEAPDHVTASLNRADVQGAVEFNHVSFGYFPHKLLMKDVNISVKAGQTVAIVGPTGAGKTTLINLLMRFYEVTGGQITVDGINLAHLSRAQSRSLFGMVLQDPWLYSATIAENIAFGAKQTTEAEIVAAAKVANVDHYIRTLPEGYQTNINEASTNISQGQKQLLTIARALVADPPILILDEATSSVDTRLEILIQEAMETAMQGRTSFIIAHRLSTIRNADLILVMNHGTIVEQGTHEHLLAQGGMYKEIYESQFAGQDVSVEEE